MKPLLMKTEAPSGDTLKALQDEFAKSLEALSAILEYNGGEYLAGDISVADYYAFAWINDVIVHGHYELDAHPAIKTWFDKITETEPAQKLKASLEEFFAAMAAKKEE